MTRRRTRSIAANPVLIGAVTVLVAMVAVFLAYNANNGLPFVPTYTVHVLTPNAAEVVAGNDVDIGGVRVGRVSAIKAVSRGGVPYAQMTLDLQKSVEPLAADTQMVVRQRSNIGLKYVSLEPGHSKRTIPQGGSIPASNVAPVVDLSDFLNTFDKTTRTGFATVLNEVGGGLAGRGAELNSTLGDLGPVSKNLITVGRVLTSSRTDLPGFIRGLDSAAHAAAPVATQLADFFDAAATTFGAIKPADLGATLDQAALTERVGTPALTPARALLRAGTSFLQAAEPGLREVPVAAPAVARTLAIAGPPILQSRTLAPRIDSVVEALRRLSRLPDTTDAVEQLTSTVKTTVPFLQFFNPTQVKCNYVGLWTRNVTGAISQGDDLGTWFRFIAPLTNLQENSPTGVATPNLHVDPVPDEGQNGQCELGNETFVDGQHIGAAPGTQADFTEQTIPGTELQRTLSNGGKP
jgi:virulence factor Mce-like protein